MPKRRRKGLSRAAPRSREMTGFLCAKTQEICEAPRIVSRGGATFAYAAGYRASGGGSSFTESTLVQTPTAFLDMPVLVVVRCQLPVGGRIQVRRDWRQSKRYAPKNHLGRRGRNGGHQEHPMCSRYHPSVPRARTMRWRSILRQQWFALGCLRLWNDCSRQCERRNQQYDRRRNWRDQRRRHEWKWRPFCSGEFQRRNWKRRYHDGG